MSIEYSASIIAGHTVSQEEISKLDDETYEDLINNDYLHIVNSWADVGDLIFGKILVSIDCNDCTFVNTADYCLSNKEHDYLTALWYQVFHRPMPSLNHYLVGKCD